MGYFLSVASFLQVKDIGPAVLTVSDGQKPLGQYIAREQCPHLQAVTAIEVREKNPEKGSQNIQGTGEAVLQEQAKKAGTII